MNYNMSGMAAQGEILILLRILIAGNPANRQRSGKVGTVCVFVPFMLIFMGETWRWDYLWAFLCMIGAVYFVNRARM